MAPIEIRGMRNEIKVIEQFENHLTMDVSVCVVYVLVMMIVMVAIIIKLIFKYSIINYVPTQSHLSLLLLLPCL